MSAIERTEALGAAVSEVLAVDDVERIPRGDAEVLRFVGRLRMDAQVAYDTLAPRVRALGLLPLLQQEGDRVALLIVPALPPPQPSRLWLAVLLFVLTIGSTFFVGAQDLDFQTGAFVFNAGNGLAFSAALLGILLAHELGHYIMARREGVATSYPFFIPVPFSLGTLGAFIAIKEPVPNRRALLAIGIAGPLAGLAVSIPVLLIGLSISTVRDVAAVQAALPNAAFSTEGNSLLYAAAKILVFGRFLPSGGEDVFIHPVALAGWAGLLLTGLNLLPAGQLDGGHIFFALFGPRVSAWMSRAVAVILLGLGFLWSGWFLWAVLVAVLGQRHSPLLNEVSPLRGPWRALAVLGIVVFALVFTPVPFTISVLP